MKTLLSIIALVLLVGCAKWDAEYRQAEYARNLNECQSLSANLQGDAYSRWMATCLSIGSGIRPSGYAMTGQSSMAQPNMFGPYGVWGPGWQGFNSQFQGQPHSATILPPVR